MAVTCLGALLAPHRPIDERPALQPRSDLEIVDHRERHGNDEFWRGEHRSTGREVIVG